MICEKCKGLGILKYAFTVADREYCDCPMGVDLKRAEAAIEQERARVLSQPAAGTGATPRSAQKQAGKLGAFLP